MGLVTICRAARAASIVSGRSDLKPWTRERFAMAPLNRMGSPHAGVRGDDARRDGPPCPRRSRACCAPLIPGKGGQFDILKREKLDRRCAKCDRATADPLGRVPVSRKDGRASVSPAAVEFDVKRRFDGEPGPQPVYFAYPG